MRTVQRTILSVIMAGTLCGCAGYRAGSLMHPDLESVAVGDVVNRTRNPGVSTTVRSELARELARSSAAELARPKTADALLHVTITKAAVEVIAQSQVRDPVDGEDTDDVRQPVLYRTRVTLRGRLELPEGGEPLVQRTAHGQAEFDRTSDVTEARHAALDQAIQNAVRQLVSTMTQAW